MSQLKITIKAGAQNVLVGFQMKEDQYEDGGEVLDNGDEVVYVEMGDATDTTTAQEQALNTNSDVISYKFANQYIGS